MQIISVHLAEELWSSDSNYQSYGKKLRGSANYATWCGTSEV